MKLIDLFNNYQNQELPQSTLKLFGINEAVGIDKLLSADEVSIVINTSSKSYDIIRKLKAKYNLKYDESRIPASVLCDEYGMDVVHVLNYLDQFHNQKNHKNESSSDS